MARFETSDPDVDGLLADLSPYVIHPARLVEQPIAVGGNEIGGYGVVVCATLTPTSDGDRGSAQPTSTLVAVKKFKTTTEMHHERLKRRAVREIALWSGLQHENIIEFIGFHLNLPAREAWLVSPWEALGNLPKYHRTHGFTMLEKLQLIQDAGEALKYMHACNPPIAHGDIKGANVLIRLEQGQGHSRVRAVLCDFGLSRIAEDKLFASLETTGEWAGSVRWCSPELFESSFAAQTPASDVWAWAWLVWEVMTGTIPFPSFTFELAVVAQIVMLKLPEVNGEPLLRNTPSLLRQLMESCWKLTGERPSIQYCLNQVQNLIAHPSTAQAVGKDLPQIPRAITAPRIFRRLSGSRRREPRPKLPPSNRPLPRRRTTLEAIIERFTSLQNQLVEQAVEQEKVVQVTLKGSRSREDKPLPRLPLPPRPQHSDQHQHQRETGPDTPTQTTAQTAPRTAPQPKPWGVPRSGRQLAPLPGPEIGRRRIALAELVKIIINWVFCLGR